MATNWIDVNERLPEELTAVLVLTKAGEMHVAYWWPEHMRWEASVSGNYFEESDVTHWHPIEPPEKGE